MCSLLCDINALRSYLYNYLQMRMWNRKSIKNVWISPYVVAHCLSPGTQRCGCGHCLQRQSWALKPRRWAGPSEVFSGPMDAAGERHHNSAAPAEAKKIRRVLGWVRSLHAESETSWLNISNVGTTHGRRFYNDENILLCIKYMVWCSIKVMVALANTILM